MTVSVCQFLAVSGHISGTACLIFPKLFTHVSYIRGLYSSGGVAICCARTVLWMAFLYTMARNKRRNSDSTGSSTDLSPWRILRLIHEGAAPTGGGV